MPTTAELAKALEVSPSTAAVWCDHYDNYAAHKIQRFDPNERRELTAFQFNIIVESYKFYKSHPSDGIQHAFTQVLGRVKALRSTAQTVFDAKQQKQPTRVEGSAVVPVVATRPPTLQIVAANIPVKPAQVVVSEITRETRGDIQIRFTDAFEELYERNEQHSAALQKNVLALMQQMKVEAVSEPSETPYQMALRQQVKESELLLQVEMLAAKRTKLKEVENSKWRVLNLIAERVSAFCMIVAAPLLLVLLVIFILKMAK
jgi:hypothetical protein